MRNGFIFGGIVIALILVVSIFVCRCSKVDSAEIGIKFNKLSLTEQGNLDASIVTGYTFYCPITTDLHKYPTYEQRKDYGNDLGIINDSVRVIRDILRDLNRDRLI